jgi:hypothetical protein
MEIQLSAEIYHNQPEIGRQEMVSWRHRSCKIQASTELLQMSLQTAEACSTHLWISSIVPWSIVSSQIYLVRRRYGFPSNLESKREREVPVSLHLRTNGTDSHVCNRQQDTHSRSCHLPKSAAHSLPDTHSDPSFHIPIQIPASTYLVHCTPASLTPISSTRWSSKTSSNSYHFNCWLVMQNQRWSHGYD